MPKQRTAEPQMTGYHCPLRAGIVARLARSEIVTAATSAARIVVFEDRPASSRQVARSHGASVQPSYLVIPQGTEPVQLHRYCVKRLPAVMLTVERLHRPCDLSRCFRGSHLLMILRGR